MDLELWKKRGSYITYEPGGRVYMDETKYKDLNVNVVCDRNIRMVQPSPFYFYISSIGLSVLWSLLYFKMVSREAQKISIF